MWTELLPIGSVVLLRDSEKRLMVMGFCQAKPEDTSTVYDYCGCLFPEGYIDADNVYLFNHEQIDQIYALGYMDEEQFAVRDRLTQILYSLKGGNAAEAAEESQEETPEELPDIDLESLDKDLDL